MATCHVHDSVAVRMRVRVTEKEKVMQILWRQDLVGFCASPVVAARGTPVRQAPSQVDFTKSAKKSAEKTRPDLLQMWGIKNLRSSRGCRGFESPSVKNEPPVRS